MRQPPDPTWTILLTDIGPADAITCHGACRTDHRTSRVDGQPANSLRHYRLYYVLDVVMTDARLTGLQPGPVSTAHGDRFVPCTDMD